MKIYLVFPTYEMGRDYYKDFIRPFLAGNKGYVEAEIVSFNSSDLLRGAKADLVYVSDFIGEDLFNYIIMPMVDYDRNRVNFV